MKFEETDITVTLADIEKVALPWWWVGPFDPDIDICPPQDHIDFKRRPSEAEVLQKYRRSVKDRPFE